MNDSEVTTGSHIGRGLANVGIAPVQGVIHRTVTSHRRPGWADTVCGIRKRLVPAEFKQADDRPCESCWGA